MFFFETVRTGEKRLGRVFCHVFCYLLLGGCSKWVLQVVEMMVQIGVSANSAFFSKLTYLRGMTYDREVLQCRSFFGICLMGTSRTGGKRLDEVVAVAVGYYWITYC